MKLHHSAKRKYCNDHLHYIACEAPGCSTQVYAYRSKARVVVRKYCCRHIARLRNHGCLEPEGRKRSWPEKNDPQGWLVWIRAHSVEDECGCWIWKGRSVNPNSGYVNLGLPKGYPSNGHRMAYWADAYAKSGEPPKMSGLQVDHQCHILGTASGPRKLCVNPAHLVLRVPKENSAEAAYRKVRDRQVRELVAALRAAVPDHEILARYVEWL